MKQIILTSIITMLFVQMLDQSAVQAQTLKKLGLDNSSSIGLSIQTDTHIKTEGKAAIKIKTAWPTSVCLGEVTDLDIDGGKLVYRAKVKSELEGEAYLEMWLQVGNKSYFSKGLNNTVKGKSDWKIIQTPFIFQKGQKPSKGTLNLVINGKGTVWIDDLTLSKELVP